MNGVSQRVTRVEWHQVFPWLQLFRAFWIAIDLRKIFLAAAALLLIGVGDFCLSRLSQVLARPDSSLSREQSPAETQAVWPWLSTSWPWLSSSQTQITVATKKNRDVDVEQMLRDSVNCGFEMLLHPVRTLVVPALSLLDRGQSWTALAFKWTRLLWRLLVWALFAGAITRLAAVQFAHADSESLVGALGFARRHYWDYVLAPLLPLLAILLFAAVCMCGGWVGRLTGDAFVGGAWPLFFLLGLLMTLVLIGAVVGWPMMFATVSTEASDGFDGFSRTYNFVYGWPWHFGWNCLVSLVYGTLSSTFFYLVLGLACYLSIWGVEVGLGANSFDSPLRGVGGTLSLFWLNLLNLLALAFAYSFFWTVFTINYFLMRARDDGTSLSDVYIPEQSDSDELAPVVGVAASDLPVMERPSPSTAVEQSAEHDGRDAGSDEPSDEPRSG